jgi:hypothetical protein
VQSLTGLTGFDWALAQLLTLWVTLIAGSFLWRSAGTRMLGALVVPFAVGVLGCVLLLALFRAETSRLLEQIGEKPASLGGAAAVVLVAAAVADFLVSRVTGLVAAAVPGPAARASDVAMALTLLVFAVVGLVGLVRLDQRTHSAYELSEASASGGRLVEDFALPGQPMDLVLRSESEGYVSLGDGRIARFILPKASGGDLEIVTVVEGLSSPRGVGIVGNVLIVAELGPLPCGRSLSCKGEDVDGVSSVEDGERRILLESRGRLLAFSIRADGRLAERRVIVDDLPVANTDHGVNAVQAGPDGRVYVSIGNLDRLAGTARTNEERARPNFEWLGTVLSLRPDGSDTQVVASGLRNVYDLAFDADGRLYGVDNDGRTDGGWRREEVLQIRSGDHFGYPQDGTFAPYTRRSAPPLWLLETVGSGGIEWVRSGDSSKLVVGSCGDAYVIHLDAAGEAAVIREREPVAHLLSVAGCVTGVERVAGDVVAMTLFTFDGPPRLYLVELEG